MFEQLFEVDPTGLSWLPGLLEMAGLVPGTKIGSIKSSPKPFFGDNEKPLRPPVSLLRWLVQNVVPPEGRKPDGNQFRKLLLNRDPGTISEALHLLEKNRPGRAWFVLEGSSFPDVYIETDRAIVIVEGKRTEPGPTTSTTWMAVRHQMLRHLDGAWDERGNRQVHGVMLVEGDTSDGIPEPWRSYPQQMRDAKCLDSSLPHRSHAERLAIAASFLGIVTWQQLASRFQLALPD